MAKHKIAWLPGDGIGKDVMDAAKIVLDKLALDAEYIHGDIGWEFWCKEGNALPERTIQILESTDCALFGAITSKPRDEADAELDSQLRGKGLNYFSPIVTLRQKFQLHSNMRPCKGYKGNPLNYREGIDLVVFRENTEDLYAGVEYHPIPETFRAALNAHPKMKAFANVPNDEMAFSARINTLKGCTRIITSAFEFAKKANRKSVTIVEKPNVLRETSGLMVRTAREIAKKYDVPLWEANIDAMCMWLIKNPLDYDVLVTSNMFGDIISDLAGQLVGGLGFASSGNIGDNYAVFEPTHGSAPKYAGLYKVNPMAIFLSTKMMLDWLGETTMANKLDSAIAEVLADGKVRTYDMGGTASTLDMANAVESRL